MEKLGHRAVPVIEVLHEIDFCFEGVDLFFEATREANLFYGEQLPGTLIQAFKNLLILRASAHKGRQSATLFRPYENG